MAPLLLILPIAISLVLTSCGGGGDTGPNAAPTLTVVPENVGAGDVVNVSVDTRSQRSISADRTTHLDRQEGPDWVPVYVLVSHEAGRSSAEPPTTLIASVGLPPGATEKLTIPNTLSPGTYRLVKTVVVNGQRPSGIAAMIQVVG